MDPKLYKQLLDIFKDELKEQHQVIVDALLVLEETSDKNVATECVQVLFRSSHNIKGAAKSVAIDSIAAISHKLEDVFSEWREETSLPSKDKINSCLSVADNLLIALQDFYQKKTRLIETYLEPLTTGVNSLSNQLSESDLEPEDQVKIPLVKLKHIDTKVDDLLIHKLKLNLVFKKIEILHRDILKINGEISNVEKYILGIKDEVELMADNFARDLSALQTDLLDLHLQPISDILTPLKRTARDLSKALDKPISFEVKGGEIKIDRSILLLLRDPFQHLMRNAIEHGIEDKPIRLDKGKPATAIISINVSQQFGNVYIEFCDNGKGLDKNKILEKVKSKLEYSQEKLARLTEEKLYDLIFQAGFSTQTEVSELSGRGVGLDAVKKNIEQAKGHISVTSVKDKNTSFKIIVPQNLSASRGVFVKANGITFVLPTRDIQKLFIINANDILNKDKEISRLKPIMSKKNIISEHYLEQSNERLVFIQHKKRTPVRHLHLLQGMSNCSKKVELCDYQGVLLQVNGQEMLVLVDEILREEECLVKPLPVPISKLKIYEGGTLTANGELLLVFNATYLIKFLLATKNVGL